MGRNGSSGGGSSTSDKAVIAALVEQFDGCVAKSKSWIPAQTGDDAAGSGTCGDPLVAFCCNLEALKERYAGFETYEPRITARESENYQIYSCSRQKTGVMVHLIKREKKKTYYDEVKIGFLDGRSPDAADGDGEACVPDLKKILQGEKVAVGEPAGDPVFEGEINAVLKRSCDGKGCHANGNVTPPPYVDNRANTVAAKELILDRLTTADEKRRMPPVGQEMPEEDLEALQDWLESL